MNTGILDALVKKHSASCTFYNNSVESIAPCTGPPLRTEIRCKYSYITFQARQPNWLSGLANKYWIYGEDAALAAQFTAYLATVLKNRRLTYIRHLKKIQKVECSYEYAAETIEHVDSIREESLESAVEAKLMWEAIKPYLHKLSPKECEVMICLYIDRLSIADTATKLKIKPDTVSTHKHNAINKIRKAMGEH